MEGDFDERQRIPWGARSIRLAPLTPPQSPLMSETETELQFSQDEIVNLPALGSAVGPVRTTR